MSPRRLAKQLGLAMWQIEDMRRAGCPVATNSPRAKLIHYLDYATAAASVRSSSQSISSSANVRT